VNEDAFSYEALTQRNIGFLTQAEQARLRGSELFIVGVGGMGGACLMSLARCGLGAVTFADFDRFEVSNLNRQLFANLDQVGKPKTLATQEQLLRLNPGLQMTVLGKDWIESLDAVLQRCKVVVNGMDDVRQGIALYRAARTHGATVIDAYMSPLPSVFVVKPGDPRPEERLGYPSLGRDWRSLSDADVNACVALEVEHVMTHSSSAEHVDLDIAGQVVAGKRPRMSLAPMVISTGNLMAFEALRLLLDRPGGPGPRGYFFNPWSARVETPLNPLSAAVKGWFVRRFMRESFGA
jgi:molybdopterin/thiamine biosynthesis adenylyltransferase